MAEQDISYTVQAGDTLWSIAHKFQVDIEKIKFCNNLIDDVVYEGQELLIPGLSAKSSKLVSAYSLGRNDAKELKEYFKEVGSHFDILIFCYLELNLDGQIRNNISTDVVEFGQEEQIKIISLIQNYNFERKIIDSFLNNKIAKEKVIEELVEIIKNYELAGFNIDFEYISPTNRSYLNNFIYNLADAIRDLGALVTISVPAKIKEDFSSNWTGAFDYETLGNHVDQMMIMGYDYHWRGGVPGPIAPIYWLEDVIEYALTKVSKEKIILGLPTYGYDWEVGSNNLAQALSYTGVKQRLDKYDGEYSWDEDSSTPYFKYQSIGEEHVVWFEDLTSLEEKLKLVKKYDLGGVVFWRLGLEDKRIWRKVRKKISKEE
jgi:spore germination protein YaaH